MFTVKSNLPINGRYWGLPFTDGVAHTENAALAAKLLLKGYVVTDEVVQPETDSQPNVVPLENTVVKQTPEAVRDPAITPAETTAAEPLPEAVPQSAIAQAEATAKPEETPKSKTTKPRKKAVTADAADESGV